MSYPSSPLGEPKKKFEDTFEMSDSVKLATKNVKKKLKRNNLQNL